MIEVTIGGTGIDTSTFSADLVREASSSAAASTGISTVEILKAVRVCLPKILLQINRQPIIR